MAEQDQVQSEVDSKFIDLYNTSYEKYSTGKQFLQSLDKLGLKVVNK